MKILVATEKPFAPLAISQIRDVAEKGGHTLALLEKYSSTEQLHAAVADADAMIVRSDIVDAALLAVAPKLKIVVRAGAGYDNLDLNGCTASGVVAMNTPGQNSNAVAELAFGMMLYSARGGFDGKTGSELMGKRLGLHAFGYVGRCMARIASGFGMETCAYDPFVDHGTIRDAGVTPVDTVDELYSTCQYVSLHIPANEKTRGSIGEKLISLMPVSYTHLTLPTKRIV